MDTEERGEDAGEDLRHANYVYLESTKTRAQNRIFQCKGRPRLIEIRISSPSRFIHEFDANAIKGGTRRDMCECPIPSLQVVIIGEFTCTPSESERQVHHY